MGKVSPVAHSWHPRFPHPCACHRDPVTRSLSRERLFRVADATLLDSGDKHRNEERLGGCRGGDVRVDAAPETLGGRRDGDVGRGSRPRRWAIAATKTSDNCFAGNAHFRVPAKNISIDGDRTAQ